MIRKSLLRRYARSLAEVAREVSITDAVRRDLRVLQAVSEQVPEFLAAMRNPVVPQETKRAIVDDLSRRCGFQKHFAQFLRVLVEHHRIVHVNAIGVIFDEEADVLSGVVRARVATARALEPARRDRLAADLRRILDRNVAMEATVDPALIGGLRVQVGGTVYDGSVRSQLDRLKRRLAGF
ncbi:MAG TPA: ATP synthase F1 subunit delta [Acidobacteriota bacterium]|nr:ATP synthase F1 subunit delta [Acidobacteriota bacterium]HQM62880.1 ATP synthase F1 subunit delta [Acidobacteriota bacterium]